MSITVISSSAVGQQVLQGVVTDARTGEPLAAATVQVVDTEHNTVTESEGSFRISGVEQGSYTLLVRFIGYQNVVKEIDLADIDDRESVEISLEPIGVDLEDVIITASPTGSDITYQSAHSYSAEELQQRASASFGEMLDGEPGISMRSFGPAPSRPVIRGFDGDRVLILENGNRMGDLSNTAHDHNISLDPLAADYVEVVRGPASLLYGSSAIGGVVNLITSDMPRNWSPGSSGNLSLDGSSMNDGVSGYGRYQYGEESWATTGRLSYRSADDLRTPEGTLPGTFINNLEGSAGFGYRTDRFESGLTFSAIDHNFGLPEELDDPDEEAEIRMDQQSLQGRANWSNEGFIENIEWRLHGSRIFQQEVETEYEGNGIYDEDIELEFLQYAMNSTITLRHRPHGFFDEGAFGVSIESRNIDVGGEEAFTPGADSWTAALFTYNEVPLWNNLHLQFGFRGEARTFNTRTNDDFPDIDEQRTSRALSGSIGLNVNPLSNLELGAQFARSHRFPILEEFYADGVHFGMGVYERGEPTLNTEVGQGIDVFAMWENERIGAELSGFYYSLSDYIAFEPTGQIYTDDRERDWDIYEYNAREAEVLGGEAQLSVVLTEELSMAGVLDYVRGTNVDSDEPLPTMPPLRGRIKKRYETDNWWIGGTIRFVDDQNRVAAEEQSTSGYTLINMDTGFSFDAGGVHRVSLRVDNLTNILYRDHLSRVDRTEFGSPMPGRNFNLSYRFLF